MLMCLEKVYLCQFLLLSHQANSPQSWDQTFRLASFPGHSQILSHSYFLHSCEIKSGSGLGTRLHFGHYTVVLISAIQSFFTFLHLPLIPATFRCCIYSHAVVLPVLHWWGPLYNGHKTFDPNLRTIWLVREQIKLDMDMPSHTGLYKNVYLTEVQWYSASSTAMQSMENLWFLLGTVTCIFTCTSRTYTVVSCKYAPPCA